MTLFVIQFYFHIYNLKTINFLLKKIKVEYNFAILVSKIILIDSCFLFLSYLNGLA